MRNHVFDIPAPVLWVNLNPGCSSCSGNSNGAISPYNYLPIPPSSLMLNFAQAERLYTHLADDSGMVDLRATFETLRTAVEPDISLARFSTKVLRQEALIFGCGKQFWRLGEGEAPRASQGPYGLLGAPRGPKDPLGAPRSL